MEAGVGSLLFRGNLSVAPAAAAAFAMPVDRWLIARGTGRPRRPVTRRVAAAIAAAVLIAGLRRRPCGGHAPLIHRTPD